MSESPTTTNDVLLDDPEAGSTWFISVVSMVLLVVTILALIAIYFDFADGEVDRKEFTDVVQALTVEANSFPAAQTLHAADAAAFLF